MTDFFADLEREIRSAHPRRSRPVVPVKGLAVTAAVAATLVAVFAALGALQPAAEREVGHQPPPAEGWTEYPPLDVPTCRTRNPLNDAGTPVPRRLSERFAVLREAGSPGMGISGDMPGVVEVYARGVRVYEGVVVVPVRLGCEGQRKRGELGMCVLSSYRPTKARKVACVPLTKEPMVATITEQQEGDLVTVIVMASDDAVERVQLRGGRFTGANRVPSKNLVLARQYLDPGDSVSVGLGEPDEIIPLNCAGQPEMRRLEERLAIFREPADELSSFDAALPRGYHRIFTTEARLSEHPIDARYVVFPAGDANCATGVCIVREGFDQAACGLPDRGLVTHLVTRMERRQHDVAAVVADGVKEVVVSYDGGDGIREEMIVEPFGTVALSTVVTDRPESIRVAAGS